MSSAKTVADARKQQYQLPKDLNERTDVYDIDGYAIASELGFELQQWGAARLDEFQKTQQWQLTDELEIRLMLFYLDRWLHFGGYTYHELDQERGSLLRLLKDFTEQRKKNSQ